MCLWMAQWEKLDWEYMVQDCGMQNVVESGGLADVFGCTALVADNVGGGGGRGLLEYLAKYAQRQI